MGKNKKHYVSRLWLTLLAVACPLVAMADGGDSTTHFAHSITVEGVPAAILHTNRFLRGENSEVRVMNHASALKLKFAFADDGHSRWARLYKGCYQGVGVAIYDINPQLGNPVTAYIFQGATIKSLAPRLALNYEWNLGLAAGWNPYDSNDNRENRVIGSHVTAYIDADVYLKYRLSDRVDLDLGLSFTHFSNGNTAMPNSGLNTLGARLGAVCYLDRRPTLPDRGETAADQPAGRRRWGTDLLLYGAWKCKGVDTEEGAYAIPGTYGVAGFNLQRLRTQNPWLRLGASLDGVYDHSANIKLSDEVLKYSSWTGTDDDIEMPRWYRQTALGLSARAEFTMPYFSVNVGVGHYLLGAQGDLGGFYETLALKVALTSRLFANIGYSLYDYRYPNNLMLGLGWRY